MPRVSKQISSHLPRSKVDNWQLQVGNLKNRQAANTELIEEAIKQQGAMEDYVKKIENRWQTLNRCINQADIEISSLQAQIETLENRMDM